MLGRLLCYLTLLATFSTIGQAQEASARKQNPFRQRVPAKVLREALLIQDSHTKAAHVQSAADFQGPRLQQIAEKLRKNGDGADADFLLQLFQEHQRMHTELATLHSVPGEPVNVIVEAILVEEAELKQCPLLGDTPVKPKSADLRAELDRLVTMRKAHVLLHSTTLATKWNQVATTSEENCLIPHTPATAETATALQATESDLRCDTSITVIPLRMNKQLARLHVTCGSRQSRDQSDSPADSLLTAEKQMSQYEIDVPLGESSIYAAASGQSQSKLFIATKVVAVK